MNNGVVLKRVLYGGNWYTDCCGEPVAWQADDAGNLSANSLCCNCRENCEGYVDENNEAI